MADVKVLINAAFGRITPEVWAGCEDHVLKIEENYWRTDLVAQSTIQPVIINLAESNSDSEEIIQIKRFCWCPVFSIDLTTETLGKSTTIQSISVKCLTKNHEILLEYCLDLYNYQTDKLVNDHTTGKLGESTTIPEI